DPLRVLIAERRDGPARHASLRASLSWSYDHLPPDAQALFRALAVFPAGAPLETIEALAAELPAVVSASAGLLENLVTLVDAHLLDLNDAEHAHYHLLSTTRAFAQDRLRAAGEEAPARATHADLIARRLAAAQAALPTADGAAAWATLRAGVADG